MAADPNQKLFSQMTDLGRNISSLAESIKKNTYVTESLVSATEKSDKRKKEEATASNKAFTDNPRESEKSEGAIKNLTKAISGLLGDKGPLVGKIAEMVKGSASKGGDGSNKDFSNIAGGLKGIIKAFQEGGVANKEGKYLVGENGPEVVKLPKGAGVIPINVKDLMAGLKKVPDLSGLIKNSKNDNLNFFGSSENPGLIDSDGMIMNLRRLSTKYEDLGDGAKDEETKKSMDSMREIIDSLMTLGQNGIDKEVSRIDGESTKLEAKNKFSGDELQKRGKIWDEILKDVTKDDDYYNSLTVTKAKLLATESLVDKKKSDDKDAEQVLGKSDKQRKERNNGGDSPKGENKKSALLSKIGGGAENALFSAADKATESLGSASPFAKKGLSALKGAIDKRVGLKEVLSKKEETKTDLGKKSAEAIETAKSMRTPALVSDVKKLAPLAKKGAPKEKESLKETKAAEIKLSPDSTKSTAGKSAAEKKSETPLSGTTGSVSDKDIQDIKSALNRMAGLLEGTLTVSVLDHPFRPDSRRV